MIKINGVFFVEDTIFYAKNIVFIGLDTNLCICYIFIVAAQRGYKNCAMQSPKFGEYLVIGGA